jgi:hypothetical protein
MQPHKVHVVKHWFALCNSPQSGVNGFAKLFFSTVNFCRAARRCAAAPWESGNDVACIYRGEEGGEKGVGMAPTQRAPCPANA